jgi:E3 ubiquitin-protein ligase Mdm2
VNAPDIVWMDTPLHGAAKGGHADVVSLLVAHSAAVNARAKDGSTPLHYAANSPDIVRSSLDVAAHYGVLQRSATRCSALVGAGADLTIQSDALKFPRDNASDVAAFDRAAWGGSHVHTACPPIGVVVGSAVGDDSVVVGSPVGAAVLDTDEVWASRALCALDIHRNAYTRSYQVGTTCVVCFKEPINSTIVHGETGHVCCCVACAKRLQAMRQPCPLCREPISAVVRNFHA